MIREKILKNYTRPLISISESEADKKLSSKYIKTKEFGVYHFPTSVLESHKHKFKKNHWLAISKHQPLDEDFIIKNKDFICWQWFTYKITLSLNGLNAIKEKIDYNILHYEQQITTDMAREYIEDVGSILDCGLVDWKWVSANTILDSQFVVDFSKYLLSEWIDKNNNITNEEKEEFKVLRKLVKN
jgi:hypothetical protein